MTFTHQQQILYKEFLDEYIGEHTLDNFIEWCKYEIGDVSKPDVAAARTDVLEEVLSNTELTAIGEVINPAKVAHILSNVKRGVYVPNRNLKLGEAPDPNTPTRPVDDRKCFKCLKGEGHNEEN